jgi:lysophospholipase L1-like esterase
MRRALLIPLLCAVFFAPEPLHTHPPQVLAPPAAAIARFPSVIPADRLQEPRWKQRFDTLQPLVENGGYDLVFIGDSITQNWEGAGSTVWANYYARRRPLNLGFSGDHTEHVLWRLTHGELTGLHPKVFVLLIGTNNTGHRKDPPEQTAAGVKRIIDLLRVTSPGSKILLLSIFPRGEQPDGPMRQLNRKTNLLLSRLADGSTVRWLDLWNLFLTPGGKLTRDITPDFLHPQTRGYQMWAEAMEPTLKTMLGE